MVLKIKVLSPVGYTRRVSSDATVTPLSFTLDPETTCHLSRLDSPTPILLGVALKATIVPEGST